MYRSVFLLMILGLLLVSPAQAGYQWRRLNDGEFALWRDGVQVGNYLIEAGYYPRLRAGVWDAPGPLPAGVGLPPGVTPRPTPKPAACPCCGEDCDCAVKPCGKPGCHCVLPAGKVESDGTVNFGIDTDAIKQGKHIVNGKEVTKAELMQAIGKPDLPDDSKQLSVTIIGAEAERQKVMQDLDSSPALAPWKGKIKVQGYDPNHWAVAQSGFVTSGHPTIYCQAPDGKVLHRQDDYRGPEALAEALRKADPAYKADKDPNLNKPVNLQAIPTWAWVGGAVILFLLLKGDK